MKSFNCTIHKMLPSLKYLQIMKNKWKNTKEQKNLMLNEKCMNSKIVSFTIK